MGVHRVWSLGIAEETMQVGGGVGHEVDRACLHAKLAFVQLHILLDLLVVRQRGRGAGRDERQRQRESESESERTRHFGRT